MVMTNSKSAVKIEKILIGKNSKTLSYKRERVLGPEWSVASHEKSPKSNLESMVYKKLKQVFMRGMTCLLV